MQYPTEIKLKPFSLTENFCYVTAIVDPVTFYKRRTTIIIGISGSITLVNVMLYFRGRGIVGGGGGSWGKRRGVVEMSQLKILSPQSSSLFSFPPIPYPFRRLSLSLSLK